MKKKIWTSALSVTLTSVIIKVIFILCVGAAFYAPTGIPQYSTIFEKNVELQLFICFYFCIALAIVALITLNKLIANIHNGNIFTESSVKCLRLLSWCCYFVAIATLVYSIFDMPFLIISAAAAFFGLILRVVKNVFEEAVKIREENDYTI